MRVRMLVLSALLAVTSCAIMLAVQASPWAKVSTAGANKQVPDAPDPMGDSPHTGRARYS